MAYTPKKMMGGLCFMVDGKMLAVIIKNELMARIGLDAYADALQKPGCKEINFTGRAMKGFVFLDPSAIDMEEDLHYWIQLCLDFNPLAKASKKKKRRLKNRTSRLVVPNNRYILKSYWCFSFHLFFPKTIHSTVSNRADLVIS